MYPTTLQLVHYPHPVLRRPSEAVTVFDDELERFCQAMFAAMEEYRGVGLAAPQVGVSRRIFVTNHVGLAEDAEPDPRVWINPELQLSGPEHDYDEGCLSIPGLFGTVTRPSQVKVTWQDATGTRHEASFDSVAGDFLAVVIQHEFDHLEGILFLDHIPIAQLAMMRRKLKDMEKTYKKATGKAGAVLRR